MLKLKFTLQDLFDLPGAEIYNPDGYKNTGSVSIDSRNVKKNSIFVAIEGENFDGHKFVSGARENGASTFIINKNKLTDYDDVEAVFIAVNDTTEALGDLANAWRKKINAKVISITGSAGKTTTKEMLAVLLSEKFRTNKTIKNNNNHIGVPLTILSADEDDEVLILEHGTNHFGEIEYTTKIAQPDFALITNIGSSHLEFLKDLDGVCEEKSALFKIADESGGLLIVNNDDPRLVKVSKTYREKVTYGFKGQPDIKGKIKGFSKDGKPSIEVKTDDKIFSVELPVYGKANVKNFLAAAAAALQLGMNEDEIINGAKKIKQVDKRLYVTKFKNFVLIDDTYNSNPESLKNALELTKKIKIHKKKIAVLGDMFELGKRSAEIHEGLADVILDNKIDEIYLTGSKMKFLNKELQKYKIKSKYFSNREKLSEFIGQKDFSESIVLVKGSRGMKMEEFADKIKEAAE